MEGPSEHIPQSYDREAVEREAMERAQELLDEKGFKESPTTADRLALIAGLMSEFSEGNEYRHLVEALARVRKAVEVTAKYREAQIHYPEATNYVIVNLPPKIDETV